MSLPLRPACDSDAQDLFGLLALCFAEYPGCFVDPHDDLPDLLRPGRWMERSRHGRLLGGAFLVLEDDAGRIAACVAVDFPEPCVAELHRLYVRPDSRRRGIAGKLVAEAERRGMGEGARRMVLWSDSRFLDAHRLYGTLGYTRTGGDRDLGDISGSREFEFAKAL